MINEEYYDTFKGSKWKEDIDVRDFIVSNYTPYDGDESFLVGPTENASSLWAKLQELQKKERENGGVLDMEEDVVSSLTSYGPGYLDKDKEVIVGLQSGKPLIISFMPYGGIKMA